jgi:hypothetical protein
MIHSMPAVHPEIEQDESAWQMCPGGKFNPMKQAESVLFGPMRNGQPQADTHKPVESRIQSSESEIPQPVPRPVRRLSSELDEERRHRFPRQQNKEHDDRRQRPIRFRRPVAHSHESTRAHQLRK